MAMKRMTYLCRIGRTSLGLPRQAKADMSIKTAQLPALCLLNQYGIKKLSTVSDNKSKKCLVKSGKDKLSYKIIFTITEIIFTSLRIIFTFLLIVAGKTKAGSAPRRALPACKANLIIYIRWGKYQKVLRRV